MCSILMHVPPQVLVQKKNMWGQLRACRVYIYICFECIYIVYTLQYIHHIGYYVESMDRVNIEHRQSTCSICRCIWRAFQEDVASTQYTQGVDRVFVRYVQYSTQREYREFANGRRRLCRGRRGFRGNMGTYRVQSVQGPCPGWELGDHTMGGVGTRNTGPYIYIYCLSASEVIMILALQYVICLWQNAHPDSGCHVQCRRI